jgi:hypothetical protein
VQTTNRWYHANTHFFYEGKPSKPAFRANGWPIFQGHGGHGNYVAVLNPQFDSLAWSSVIANCEHLDAVACEKGLAVVARCTGDTATDGRTPAFMPYDVADWPGLIAGLTAAAKPGPPSPARQVWTRLAEPVRAALAALPPGKEPSAEWRARVLEEFDRILFDDRTFYDSAAWPNAAFDPLEARIVAQLRAGAVSDDDLGYLNRTLFEQGFPQHVFARPKHNLTPALRATQGRHGGGVSDGYIYLLRSPPGRRLDLVPEPAPAAATPAAERPAPARTASVPPERRGSGTTTTRAIGGTLEFAFAPDRRRAARLPGYCTTYAILRNATKRRPMFLHGGGESGGIRVTYGNDGGLKEGVEIASSGSGTLLLNGANTKPAADWSGFACGEWLLKEKDRDPLRITVGALRGWTEITGTFEALINPARIMMTPEQLAQLAARFRVTTDLTISVGPHTATLADVPCALALRDLGGVGNWGMRLDLAAELTPAQLGLAREGTNRVTMVLTHEAFAPTPEDHAAPRAKKMATTLDDSAVGLPE